MCEYSGRLIAWLDRDLPDDEATNVEWHAGQCAECRKAVSEYREVSDAFLTCYERQMEQPAPKPHSWRWGSALAGVAAAAAIVAIVVLAQPPVEKLSFHLPSPRPPASPPIMAAARARVPLRRRPIPSPTRRPWTAEEPVVEVALPADALFPPGAVPEGFSFIADVRFQQ
jgi:Putative zinc-finger